VNAGEAIDVRGQMALDVGRVPEVPEVDHDPDVGEPGFVEQLQRLRDRADERQSVALGDVDRLETQADARAAGCGGDAAQPADDEGTRLVLVPRPGRAGEAEDAVRLKGGEAVHRRADRLDPLLDVVRAFDDAVRQDRRDGRHAVRRLQPGGPERLEIAVGVVAELHLPDADAVEAGRGIRAQIFAEARGHRRDLGEGEDQRTPGSFPSSRRASGGRVRCFATR
jgi:hypothetical protein